MSTNGLDGRYRGSIELPSLIKALTPRMGGGGRNARRGAVIGSWLQVTLDIQHCKRLKKPQQKQQACQRVGGELSIEIESNGESIG